MLSIQNVIRTRYKFAEFEAIKGQGSMLVYSRIFLIGVPGVLKHKNEIHA